MMNVIEKINVVAFDVTSISGTVSREPGDNPTVFTAGAVRYINPDKLRVFAAARQQANRLCRNRGVRFLSGWAVPDESVDPLVAELNEIAKRVESAKADLLAHWDEHLAEWQAQQPQVAPYALRFPRAEYVAHQTGARLSVYRINPSAVNSVAADGIREEVDGLAGRVLREIAQDVQDTWKPGATQASQRIKNLLRRLENKCRTLEFLGGNLGALASFIEQAIQRLPIEGPIQGQDFTVLVGILSILSSTEKMEGVSKIIASGGIVEEAEVEAKAGEAEAEVNAEAEAEAEVNAEVIYTPPAQPSSRVSIPAEAWNW